MIFHQKNAFVISVQLCGVVFASIQLVIFHTLKGNLSSQEIVSRVSSTNIKIIFHYIFRKLLRWKVKRDGKLKNSTPDDM
jgi:hypothetical protein